MREREKERGVPGYCFRRQRKQSAASDVGLLSSAFASPIISKCKGMPVCVCVSVGVCMCVCVCVCVCVCAKE